MRKRRHVPIIIEEAVKKAQMDQLSERQLASLLGIDSGNFSRMVKGYMPLPDLRKKKNKSFYRKLGEFLGVSVGEVIASVLPLDDEELQELSRYFWSLVKFVNADPKSEVAVVAAHSPSFMKKMEELSHNFIGREHLVDLLVAQLRAVVDAEGSPWISDAKTALMRAKKINAERGAEELKSL